MHQEHQLEALISGQEIPEKALMRAESGLAVRPEAGSAATPGMSPLYQALPPPRATPPRLACSSSFLRDRVRSPLRSSRITMKSRQVWGPTTTVDCKGGGKRGASATAQPQLDGGQCGSASVRRCVGATAVLGRTAGGPGDATRGQFGWLPAGVALATARAGWVLHRRCRAANPSCPADWLAMPRVRCHATAHAAAATSLLNDGCLELPAAHVPAAAAAPTAASLHAPTAMRACAALQRRNQLQHPRMACRLHAP